MSTNGRFVWFDLMTGAVEGAKAFYTHVLEWGTEAWDGPMPYTLWTVAKGEAVGGLMPLPAEAGAPPHWLGYVETGDIAKCEALVKELGGAVHHSAEAIPGVGKFAVVADPQGAVFALLEPENDQSPAIARERIGNFSWAELNTTDWKAAFEFYSTLFGWVESGRMEMREGAGDYVMFHEAGGDRSSGGLSNMAQLMGVPAHWLFYTNVSDLDLALSRVKEGGGKVLNGPMEIPGNARIAQCRDPEGAYFALYAENE